MDELILNGVVQDYFSATTNGVGSGRIINGVVDVNADVGDFYASINGDNSTGVSWATAKNTIATGAALATGANKTIIIDGGSYDEYLLLDWHLGLGTTLKGASQYGHNTPVIINGQNRAVRIAKDNITLENLTLNATADNVLQIINQDAILNNITFKKGANRIYIQDTDSSSTTTFNNCILQNDGDETAIQMTSAQEGNIIFNNCYFKELPNNFVVGLGTYTFNDCFFMIGHAYTANTTANTPTLVFNRCYFFGAKVFSYPYINNNIAGDASITMNDCFYQRTPYLDSDIAIHASVVTNDCWQDILNLNSRRRYVAVSLGIDDTQYYDGFEALRTEADLRGVPAQWHISPYEMTAQNWIDANDAVENGHEIYSHGNVYSDYMGDLFAFTIEYTGAGAGTIEIASDTLILKVDGSPVKTIDLTTDTVSDTVTDIDSTADFTCALISETRHSENPATQLADIGSTSVNTEATISLESTYYAWVATQSKANIEANMPGYTLDVFVYPQHGFSEEAVTALQDAGFIGAGRVLGNSSWLFDSSFDLYKVARVSAGGLDYTTTATLKKDVSAVVETAGYFGGTVQFYSHGLAEMTQEEWGLLIDAIQDLNIPINTLRDNILYIRNNATVTDNRTADFTFDDDDWLPQVLL